MKSYRQQLEEVGGYENGFIAVQAFIVRQLISELEIYEIENRNLKVALEQCQINLKSYKHELKKVT